MSFRFRGCSTKEDSRRDFEANGEVAANSDHASAPARNIPIDFGQKRAECSRAPLRLVSRSFFLLGLAPHSLGPSYRLLGLVLVKHAPFGLVNCTSQVFPRLGQSPACTGTVDLIMGFQTTEYLAHNKCCNLTLKF